MPSLVVIAAVVYGVTLLACLAAGHAQLREGASYRRWVGVAMLAAVAGTLPQWVALGSMALQCAPDPVGIVGATVATALFAVKTMRPLAAQLQVPRLLPLRGDALVARVAELAASLRLRPPRVWLLGSLDGALDVNAAAGGTVAPGIVVCDGLVHRLPQRERDAILAHELAHLKLGGTWPQLWGLSLAWTAAMLAGTVLPFWTVLAFGACAMVGADRVVGHFLEPRCDVLAARVVGYAAMAGGLDHVHAAQAVHASEWLRGLVHATQTHPSLEVRLAVLARNAPPAERAQLGVDRARARRHRLTAALVATLWVGSLAASFVWPGPATAFALVVVALLPLLVLAAAFSEALLDARVQLLHVLVGPLARLLVVGAGCWVMLMSLNPDARALAPWPMWSAAGLVLVVAGFIVGRRSRRVNRAVLQAMREQDLGRALELQESLPPRVRRRRDQQLLHAQLLAARGERARAVEELDALCEDAAGDRDAAWWRARFLRELDPARALPLATALAARRPRHVPSLSLHATTLLRLGRAVDAEPIVQRMASLDPRQGRVHAIAARVALALGDPARAEAALAVAERRAPGDALVRLVRAELAHALGRSDAAEAMAEARAAVAAAPFAFLGADLERLEATAAAAASEQQRCAEV